MWEILKVSDCICSFSVCLVLVSGFLQRQAARELSHGRGGDRPHQPAQGRPHPRLRGLPAPSAVEAGPGARGARRLRHLLQARRQGPGQDAAAAGPQATRGRRALALHLLPRDVQPRGQPAGSVPRRARPHQAVHLPAELHAVRREHAVPLHVRLGGRLLGPVLLRRQRGAVLCALAGAAGAVSAGALHVLLPTAARLPPLRRGLPVLWGEA